MNLINKYLWIMKYLGITCLVFLSSRCFSQTITQDSIVVSIEPSYDKVSGAHRFFLGDNYRKLWATPVKIKVLHLATEKGGLKILQLGGGYQTRSLRMQDPTGQEWVLRTIQKYPDKVLPATLRPTIAAAIIQDQISAEHPFAALTVPPLADALHVPHAHPQIVYVPDDPALGIYRKDFANQVYLFEEREPLDVDKTDNVTKVQDKIQDDNSTRVDQHLVLRARLLDMLLGDWDRHEDQWRFERIKDSTSGAIFYKPVPRDRDQVYNSTHGVIPVFVTNYLSLPKFQPYGKHIRSINLWNLGARNFDRYFLNELTEKDWEQEIAYVLQHLTDQVIMDAMHKMPDTIYKMSGEKIAQNMIARRNGLREQALGYYRFISKIVTIHGSDKKEIYEINNGDNGDVTVDVKKLKKSGNTGDVIYHRVFDPAVTNEIRIYGFDGKDVFHVSGTKHSPITVRMIGGNDRDSFVIDSALNGKDDLYIYNKPGVQNNLPASSQAHIVVTADTAILKFNRLGYIYNLLQPYILATYNKDYGFDLGGIFVWEKQGFGKVPYASKQTLSVHYGFGNNSLLLNYAGDFKKAIGNNDLVVNVLSKGPHYNTNFFGLGNNSRFINTGDDPIEYYRNVYDLTDADVQLQHTYGHWTFSAGGTAEYYNSEAEHNQNRFLNSFNQSNPGEDVYSQQTFAGLTGTVSVDTRDKGITAHKGIYWTTTISGATGLNVSGHTYGQITTQFSSYINPDKDSVLVIVNRIGGGTTRGRAGYYQQLQLGGDENLRGYYTGRFTGMSMAYDDFELRLKLLSFNSYLLPGTLGLVGFNDVGRVWSPNGSSGTWHDGYGGGVYFLPAQLIFVEGVVGFSNEGTYPYITVGYKF